MWRWLELCRIPETGRWWRLWSRDRRLWIPTDPVPTHALKTITRPSLCPTVTNQPLTYYLSLRKYLKNYKYLCFKGPKKFETHCFFSKCIQIHLHLIQLCKSLMESAAFSRDGWGVDNFVFGSRFSLRCDPPSVLRSWQDLQDQVDIQTRPEPFSRTFRVYLGGLCKSLCRHSDKL